MSSIPQDQQTQQEPIRLSSVKALVFKQVRFWLSVNGGIDETDPETGKKTHWIFKSARQLTEELHKLYPGLTVSRETVSRALRSLVSMGLLQAEKKRKSKWDQTTWFSLTELGSRITGKTSSPDPDQPTQTNDHTPLVSSAQSQQKSTSSRTSKKRTGGFQSMIRPQTIDRKRGSAEPTGFAPQPKPQDRVLINGIWCVQDNLFPLSAT